MAIRRQAAVPRWAIATLGGVTVATALIALFTLALGFDFGVAAVLGGGLGLVIVLFVARQFAAATVVMGDSRWLPPRLSPSCRSSPRSSGRFPRTDTAVL